MLSDYGIGLRKNRLHLGNGRFNKLIKLWFYSMIKNVEKEFLYGQHYKNQKKRTGDNP